MIFYLLTIILKNNMFGLLHCCCGINSLLLDNSIMKDHQSMFKKCVNVVAKPSSALEGIEPIKRILCVGFLFLLILLSTAILVAIFLGVFDDNIIGSSWKPEPKMVSNKRTYRLKHMAKPEGNRVRTRFYLSGNMRHLQKYSLDKASRYCERLKKRLPVPVTEREELRMIEDIKLMHEKAECDYYAIGYKLDFHMRYSSLDEKTIWPSMLKTNSAAVDIKDRDCMRVEIGPSKFKIIGSKRCDDVVNFDSFAVFYYGHPRCEKDPWNFRCLNVMQGTRGTFKQVMKEQLKSSDTNVVGLLLLDRELIPRKLLARSFKRKIFTWILEIKYVMNYLDVYDSNLAPYKINVTIFQDPERECIAVNSKKGFQIETVHCSDTGCPACEDELF